MADVVVVGYGNPLRGDDGFGWRAAERLERELGARAEVVTCHQLTPELAEPLGRARLAIFLDADATAEPGVVTVADVADAPGYEAATSHHLTPAALLACSERLYGGRPRGVTITVGAASFGYEERLSPAVEAAIERAVAAAFVLCDAS